VPATVGQPYPGRAFCANHVEQERVVRWFRRTRRPSPTLDRDAFRGDREHLEEFAGSRPGVEAYLEPRTTVTQTTVMLIAHDGEWTRRRVASPEAARRWAAGRSIPFYEVALTGYPQRMRDFNARHRNS
jgi:hypothetical protein